MKMLVCIRQLPYAEPTVSFGGLFAHLAEARVNLMTVIDREDERPAAEAELERAKSLLTDLQVKTTIRKGEAVSEILNESKGTNYDMVVVGSHEANTIIEALLGTITGKVAEKAGSSVLVVKGERSTKLEKILVAVGGHKMNKGVVKFAGQLAKAADAALTVLYVTNPVPTMYTGLEEIEETLEELLQTDTPIAQYLRWSAAYLSEKGVKANVEIAQGVPAEEIMRQARIGDYDLIVIGARSLFGLFQRLFVDRVTPNVVERAPCCVLVVR